MLKLIDLTLENWKIILLTTLVLMWGIQTYRLQGAKGQIALYEYQQAQQKSNQAKQELANLRNKERTDEEYASAKRRAATVIVRSKPRTIIASQAPSTGGNNQPSGCVTRGEIDRTLTEFAREHAAGLTAIYADFSQRHAVEATAAVQQLESLAAAYRACRAFAIGDDL